MTNAGFIAIVILCAAILLFVTNRFPMCAVAMLGGAAMAASGVIEPSQAFSGLSSSAVLYLIGMGVVSQALIDAGYIEYIKRFFLRNENISERKLILLFIVVFALVSAFFQGIVIMLMIMPVICAMEKETNGRISRKQMYMPLGFASLFGGNFMIIGSSSMLNAVGQAEAFTGTRVSLGAPFFMGLAAVATLFLFYATVGYPYQHKIFTFESLEITACGGRQEEHDPVSGYKKWMVLLVFLGCIAGFVSGMDTGYVSLAAAAVLIALRCIDVSAAFASVDWSVVFTVTGCVAIGRGVESSGAGIFLANKIVELAGSLGRSPVGMCVIMLVISSLLSNFMSNNAAVTISVPIAMSIAVQLGADPVVYAVACGVGANLSVATPLATTVTAIITSAGYRFSDYLAVGGLLNVLVLAAVSLSLKLFYF